MVHGESGDAPPVFVAPCWLREVIHVRPRDQPKPEKPREWTKKNQLRRRKLTDEKRTDVKKLAMHYTRRPNTVTPCVGLTAWKDRHEFVDGVSAVRISLAAWGVTLAVAQEQAHNLEIPAISREQPRGSVQPCVLPGWSGLLPHRHYMCS